MLVLMSTRCSSTDFLPLVNEDAPGWGLVTAKEVSLLKHNLTIDHWLSIYIRLAAKYLCSGAISYPLRCTTGRVSSQPDVSGRRTTWRCRYFCSSSETSASKSGFNRAVLITMSQNVFQPNRRLRFSHQLGLGILGDVGRSKAYIPTSKQS